MYAAAHSLNILRCEIRIARVIHKIASSSWRAFSYVTAGQRFCVTAERLKRRNKSDRMPPTTSSLRTQQCYLSTRSRSNQASSRHHRVLPAAVGHLLNNTSRSGCAQYPGCSLGRAPDAHSEIAAYTSHAITESDGGASIISLPMYADNMDESFAGERERVCAGKLRAARAGTNYRARAAIDQFEPQFDDEHTFVRLL
jgi:hypothetical protein